MAKDQTDQNEWALQSTSETLFDPLLGCLVSLTKLYHQPVSEKTLLSGLPLVDHRLTPELFSRAAKRASLSAKLVKHSLSDIQPHLCPVVLLLTNQRACVLTKIKKNGTAKLIQPESGEGEKTVKLSELEHDYTGFAIFVGPTYRFDRRAKAPGKEQKKHWFWSAISKSLPTYGEVLLASLLINVFAVAIPLFVMNVYDRVVPNHAIETLWTLGLGIIIVVVFEFTMRMLRNYFIDSAARRIDLELSAETYEQVLNLNMAGRPKSVGALTNTIFSFEAFRDFIASATVSLLVDMPFIIIFLLIIGVIAGPLVLVPLSAVPLVLIVTLLSQMRMENLVKAAYRHASERQALLFESLSHIESVKAFRVESNFQHKWESITDAAAKIRVKLRGLVNLGLNFAIFIQHAATISIVIAGVYRINQGLLTIGGLIACTILTGRAVAPIAQIAGLINRYKQSKAALDGLDEIMQAPVERPQGKNFLLRSEFKGSIAFKNVTFIYPDQTVSALDNVSLHIKPGERVGIIGRMGSGKSTLAKLILKLYTPAEGSILVDDTELTQLDPAEVRHAMGYIPQEVELFDGTIKDNIVISAPYVDDSAILKAAAISGVDQFVKLHPEGYDRQVGEKGEQLSGGQRQSIAISRAMLLDPPILLFDEPTNSMDDITSKRFIKQLSHILADKTLILVTHKSMMLNLVDRLIVLDAGRVIADGPKQEVIDKIKAQKLKAKGS